MDERPSERLPDPPHAGGTPPDDDADLLTIGLVVFFVALIGTVVALVVTPALV